MSVTDDKRAEAGPSDAALIERARTGDDSALSALVRRHQEAAFRVAVSITKDEDTAQDVVQEAFVKAFRALDRFRGDASFRTWLLTIAANEGRGALRKRKRRGETSIDGIAPIESDVASPADMAELSSESARARAMLESLPEKQRLSIALRIDEGLSFREIGDVIGSSEGAARVNYFHGIRRLRELMT